MNKEEILGAFSLVNNPIVLSEEEVKDVQKAIKELQQENKKYKDVIDKATNELFILKDMIYKPETREENFEIQRKISSIIKRLNNLMVIYGNMKVESDE